MGSLPNDSVFIGSRELKGKLAPVNTDENSFSGYLAANSGCRVMGDVEADADTCRILIEEGFYLVAGSLFHEGNQGRCSKDIETAALHGFCCVCVHDHDRCFSSGTNPKFCHNNSLLSAMFLKSIRYHCIHF